MEEFERELKVVDVQVDSFSTFPFQMFTPEQQQASYERFYSRVFSVKDAFITAKRFHDWLKSGLLPTGMPQGRKNLMNLPEFIFVRLIDRLRQVGTPLDHIRALREYLFTEIDMGELAAEASQSSEGRVWVGQMLDRSGMAEEHRQAIKDEMSAGRPFANVQGRQKMTVLDSFLFHLLACSDEMGLQILQGGFVIPWAESSEEPRLKTTHVYLSLTEQVQVFRSSGVWEKRTSKLDEVTGEEWEVIHAIRDRRAKEVTVNFIEKGDKRRLDLTVTTDEVKDLASLDTQTIQRIFSGQYIDIRVKGIDGKNLYIEKNKRRRL